jgi:hypothetical protein
MAAVLPAAHQRRTRLLHHQGHRHHQHRPGWCRLTGLTPPIALWLARLLAVRNQRILASYDARQADDTRRAAAGLPPRTRKRRRTSLAAPTATPL